MNCLKSKLKSQKFIFFGVFILVFFMFFASLDSIVRAEEEVSPSRGVEYELPYPGILPDSSFYFFKVVRDRVVELFISKPLERAEYSLLQADKRVAAAKMLLLKGSGKKDLVEDTFFESLHSFEDAIVSAQEAKMQGMEVDGLVQSMVLANKKHGEVLGSMTKMKGEWVDTLRERIVGIGIRVKGLERERVY